MPSPEYQCAESGLGVGWLTRYLDMKEGPGWGLRYRNEFKLVPAYLKHSPPRCQYLKLAAARPRGSG